MSTDRFNPMDYPLSLMEPELLTGGSAWVEHIPFAFAMVEMCRPGTIVELGTSRGDSYCAFCQAVVKLKLPTRCTAIDTWIGDAHAGAHPPNLLPAFKNYHDPRYASFSRLRQGTFDDAVGEFADASIDLLHIDGLHTYEAVKHDYETWLPKMTRRGVVLFHDTQVHKADFGVWKLWDEIGGKFPNFNFRHGSGLGVLAVGSEAPDPLLRFLQIARDGGAEDVYRYFEAVGAGINNLRMLREMVGNCLNLQTMLNHHRERLALPADTVDVKASFQYPRLFIQHLHGLVQQLLIDDLRRRGISS